QVSSQCPRPATLWPLRPSSRRRGATHGFDALREGGENGVRSGRRESPASLAPVSLPCTFFSLPLTFFSPSEAPAGICRRQRAAPSQNQRPSVRIRRRKQDPPSQINRSCRLFSLSIKYRLLYLFLSLSLSLPLPLSRSLTLTGHGRRSVHS
ncbi:hypothetical protein ACLOJK_019296, partial [Asimina triloba]